jgi:DtxR family transcriptional regulator, Mn-dependent transcriptional regulator
MLPSATVENYLKAILQAQIGLSRSELVPMGQLASALGVVPGTATTMVKALAESGLVKYEPYAGVRLTSAGEKLAAMVLRRHRLIELFLVKVLGMSWTEVHEEAEHLEHAVSDRLIDRIDEVLGRPAVDPHGDPIPDRHGALDRRAYDTLLTCPVGSRVTVSRVTDQDAAFLTFVERHDLKPGNVVEVEERDEAADSVRLRGEGNKRITIGARAASKVLVQAVHLLLLALLLPLAAAAQTPATAPKPTPPPSGANRPFEITDNSFLVEEAFNQEPGIFQNIGTFVRGNGAWEFVFTQEWPAPSEKHQLSYSVPFYGGSGFGSELGDVMVNYRYQALTEDPGIPAFSPRFSLILPTSGGGSALGMQINLPFSKQRGDLYFHMNGGLTIRRFKLYTDSDDTDSSLTPHVAASGIYRVRPMFNLMLETVLTSYPGDSERDTVFTLSPGARGGWNIGDHQLILGAAVPITFNNDSTNTGMFLYASYELPFKR